MLPLRNAIPCLYCRLKDGKTLGNSLEDYEYAIPFTGVFGNYKGSKSEFGRFQTNDRKYQLLTMDLNLWSRKMKPDDVIYVDVSYESGSPVVDEDLKYRVVDFDIGVPRVNFRDQKRNEEEAPKTLYLK